MPPRETHKCWRIVWGVQAWGVQQAPRATARHWGVPAPGGRSPRAAARKIESNKKEKEQVAQ